MKDEEQFIERRIITGLIISTEYISRIREIWDSKLLGSSTAKKLANWCIEFYDQYHTAPGEEIESIFLRKTKTSTDEEIKDIEDILADLSDEYERKDKFNVSYLYDQTLHHFEERSLRAFTEDIKEDLDRGDIVSAKKIAYQYKPAMGLQADEIDLSEERALGDIEKAFTILSQPVVKYPRQLGTFLNDQMVRGGFVAFMAPEKRGKTFWLLDMAMRASRQGSNVAFFQAGDMTKEQQIIRICIYLAGKSNKEKYSGKMFEPVRDCIHNQLDNCDRKERECDFGIFEGEEESYVRDKVENQELIKALKDNPDYRPCHNCSKYWTEQWGAVWLKKVNVGKELNMERAKKAVKEFFVDSKRRFKLSSHPTRTLTVSEIDAKLDLWERQDGFIADLLIVDYMDILAPEINADFRHQENDKWMRMRGITQKRHLLGVSVTQTDAASYDRNLLSLKNFSEDKRKFGHVTAMYGLNRDKEGREKEIGILRINEIVVREDAFFASHVVHVLQNLRSGRPCLSSYW